MARLKAATAELHRHAESRPLQRQMAKGVLPREVFVAYLGQLWVVHEALERRLREARSEHPAFATVNHTYQQREPNLRGDLAFFGRDVGTIEPALATLALIDHITAAAKRQPLALLGMLYVLEGSNNGSKYIARAISRAYGLAPGPGLSYLDPYGDQQMERWQAFKRDMDRVGFAEDQIHDIVEAAKVMFSAIAQISDQ